jgi:hypothetical protein
MTRPLVFLGGTSGHNPWRHGFIERLAARGVPREALFDPVVEDWNEVARKREERMKADAEVLLFYLGDPQEPGLPLSAFTLVEATLATCREPERTIVVFDRNAVSGHARKVYEQSAKLLRAQGSKARILDDLGEAEDALAQRFAKG